MFEFFFYIMNSKKCAICDAAGTTPCENCFTVFYCCKEHQKNDWNKHRIQCKPYKIEFSEKMGRFMVSTRDIKAGEIILRESPLVVGPRVDSRLVCFGCHRILGNESHTLCSNCGMAPVCSTECELKPFHADRECSYYREKFKNVNGKFLSSNIQVVTPLRCFMLMESNNHLWENFINLESHFEERLKDRVWQFYEEKIFNILKSSGVIKLENQIIIQKICAILDINSFELRGPQTSPLAQGERLRGIYLQAAFMSHDCISNTHLSVDDNLLMTIRASIPIKSGEPVLFNYASPLENTTQRLQRLKEGKYFSCTCVRCSDPTELGTYMGSIICSRCHIGFVIPEDSLSKQTNWICNNCSHNFNERLIKTTINLGLTLIENTETADYRKLELLLKKLLRTFPEKGVAVIELKQKFIACLRDMISRVPNPGRNLLKLKANLCQELLEVLNIIEPGLSRLKGITLYELYKPKVVLANKEYDAKEITPGELLNKLKECEKILKEAISILIYEPHHSPEGRLSQIALSELKILREDIMNVTIMS